MAEISKEGCLLAGIARAQDQGEMYDALDQAVVGQGDFSRTIYTCRKCLLGVTVEYPDLMAPVEETGLLLEDGGEKCVVLEADSSELQKLKSDFAETTPIFS